MSTSKAKTSKEANNNLQQLIIAKTMESLETPAKKEVKKPTSKKVVAKKAETKEAPVTSKKAESKPKEKKEPKKTTATREVKYIYPADCTDSLSRKKFRAQTRAELHQLETKLKKAGANTKEGKQIQKEFTEFKARCYRAS